MVLFDLGNQKNNLAAPASRSLSVAATPVVDARADIPIANRANAVLIPGRVNYEALFKESHDYLDFARATLPAAKAGDADAQYRLGMALKFCESTYGGYFHRKGQWIGIDEALQWGAREHRPDSLTRMVYARCHDLHEQGGTDFGTGEEWVERAARRNQPQAIAAYAMDSYMHDYMATPRNAATGEVADPSAIAEKLGEFRAMLRTAVQSKDPEVLFAVGTAQGLFDQHFDDKMINELAWWLVSCQRGFDCSATADWVQFGCPHDLCEIGGDGVQSIRRSAGENIPLIEQRAREINANLDANNWDALGIGD